MQNREASAPVMLHERITHPPDPAPDPEPKKKRGKKAEITTFRVKRKPEEDGGR